MKIYDNVKILNRENHELKGNFIGDNCLILCRKLVMKRGSQINANSILQGRGEIFLGENVVVGYGCLLITSTDTPKARYMNDASPEDQRAIRTGNIEVEDNAFVGSYSILMPGVTIGEYSVIGAGCFIDQNVPPETVVVPARQKIFLRRILK